MFIKNLKQNNMKKYLQKNDWQYACAQLAAMWFFYQIIFRS